MNQETIKNLKAFSCILIRINEEITSCLKDKSPNDIKYFRSDNIALPEDITMDTDNQIIMDESKTSDIPPGFTYINGLGPVSGAYSKKTDNIESALSNEKNRKENDLDPNEKIIIDISGVSREKWDNWMKFRKRIAIGTNSDNLVSAGNTNNQSLNEFLKILYLTLGIAHYEIVMSIGMARISLLELIEFQSINLLARKSLKEFYVHLCTALDNFARLIYIINMNYKDLNKGHNDIIDKQKKIGWGTREKKQRYWDKFYKSYVIDEQKNIIEEILIIRNNLAHNWLGPSRLSYKDGKFYLPRIFKEKKNILWLYDEIGQKVLSDMCGGRQINSESEWESTEDLMQAHYEFFIDLQNSLFKSLTKAIDVFENNNNVKIVYNLHKV